MPPRIPETHAELEPGRSLDEVYERIRALGQENERILGDLISGERRFRRLAKAVWQVQEDERRRLARELHDGIGQTLTALKNHLSWMQGQESASAEDLKDAVELASHALDDTRELSRLLRPPVLDDLGLTAALRWLGRTVAKRFQLEVDVDAAELSSRPAPEIETVLFRIAQEASTNAAKHARAQRVRIRLLAADGQIALAIEDDGAGFDVAEVARTNESTGVGLRGMKDRLDLFGGILDIRSKPGHGTKVSARLPLAEEGDET